MIAFYSKLLIILKRVVPKPLITFIINIKLFLIDIKNVSSNKNNQYMNYLILNSESQYFNKGPHNYCHFILGHFYQFYLQWSFNPWDLHKANYDFIGLLPDHKKHLYSNSPPFIDSYIQLLSKDVLSNLNSLNYNIKRPNKIFYDNIIHLNNIHNLMSNSPDYPDANGFHEFVINNLKIKKHNKKFLTLIERSSQSDRSIINHSELKESLHSLSISHELKFQNVKLESFHNDFRKQIEIIYNSKIFIGQHGAAFANLFFVHQDASVFEINSSEYKRFQNIASSRNIDYHEIRLDPTNLDQPKNSHLHVDTDYIRSLIEAQLSNDYNSFSNYSSSS
tara:strand:+ start:640 stop:1644 length:1005 start_codon:yes stop_codon:yes gene_type:complete